MQSIPDHFNLNLCISESKCHLGLSCYTLISCLFLTLGYPLPGSRENTYEAAERVRSENWSIQWGWGFCVLAFVQHYVKKNEKVHSTFRKWATSMDTYLNPQHVDSREKSSIWLQVSVILHCLAFSESLSSSNALLLLWSALYLANSSISWFWPRYNCIYIVNT